MDALSDALGKLDQNTDMAHITEFVPADAQKVIAAAGVQDDAPLRRCWNRVGPVDGRATTVPMRAGANR